jgi:hypothetical protein
MWDVRVLRDLLLSENDWPAAAAYAKEHDAKRALAIPKLFENPSRRPDVVALGPDGPNDETVRRRFWPHAAIDPH